ncbi:CaiB/BaiF CoA transferase family protein [Pseudonocardia nigra]|uniref:CaiB/BaiF CoA transferase family protein n=1 Tax=Pseudonocardia nigra TaxID=1921578 RepID=UPI001C603E01|nr:CoA transferase [Pseudonocardia nigra]
MTAISALNGVRVLEIAHYIAGPQCCQVLADHGAEVVKIEPRTGEQGRRSGPAYGTGTDSIYFAANNRGKRSLTLDLARPEGKEVLHDLVRTADVLVTNYAAGVPEKLGFGFEDIRAINPRTVLVHITGFGRSGPKSSWVAYDGIVQAMSGLADMTGCPDGPPTIAGPFVADNVAALQGVIAVLLGLAARERTGAGQLVDAAMLDGLLPLLGHHVAAAAAGLAPTRFGAELPTSFCGLYPASDGWVYLAPVTPGMWAAFSTIVGHPEWAEHEEREPRWRLRCRPQLNPVVNDWTRSRTTREIVDICQAAGVVCGPVQSVTDVLADDHVRERGMTYEMELDSGAPATVAGPALRLEDTPARPGRRAPRLGEDDEAVLTELGYSDARVAGLRTAGITGVAS